MSDAEDKPASEGIPAWQRGQTGDDAASQPELQRETDVQAKEQPEDKIEVARRFLDHEEVKTASVEKKREFLRSKGVEDGDIQKLLGTEHVAEDKPTPADRDESAEANQVQTRSAVTAVSSVATGDRPPIVTYPEFLTKPNRPPPLVTTNAVLNTLYGFVGLSTLVYGTSKYLLTPMVDGLTEARLDLHESASQQLDRLISYLEKNVSEIPNKKTDTLDGDDASDAEDPTEMFHRDVGTQTSFSTISATTGPKKADEPESTRQANRLASFTKSLSTLKDEFQTESEDMGDIKALLDVFRDDLDGMTYGGQADFVGGYDMYGKSKKAEPEDEIRKARDNIRRIKGALLSTRNFPTSTR